MNLKCSRIPVAILALALLLTSGCTEKPAATEKTLVSFDWSAIDADGSVLAAHSRLIEKGTPAFDAMKKDAVIESKSMMGGSFVTAVNGHSAKPGEYWALYVDGEYAEYGIDAYQLDRNKRFEWRLEKIVLN